MFLRLIDVILVLVGVTLVTYKYMVNMKMLFPGFICCKTIDVWDLCITCYISGDITTTSFEGLSGLE